jgi:hypothetical protein
MQMAAVVVLLELLPAYRIPFSACPDEHIESAAAVGQEPEVELTGHQQQERGQQRVSLPPSPGPESGPPSGHRCRFWVFDLPVTRRFPPYGQGLPGRPWRCTLQHTKIHPRRELTSTQTDNRSLPRCGRPPAPSVPGCRLAAEAGRLTLSVYRFCDPFDTSSRRVPGLQIEPGDPLGVGQ